MREIKFRGKRIDNNEWVYGYLYKLPLQSGEACMILTQDNNHLDNSLEPKYHLAFTLWVDLFVVDPATVDQFTGLFDKNSKEIYEWDIIKEDNLIHKILWIDEASAFCRCNLEDVDIRYRISRDAMSHVEVIGNIHDNLDIIKKGGEL